MSLPNPRQVAFRSLFLRSKLLLLMLGLSLPAMAQYPGRTQKDEAKKVVPPRAVSVLEWVGEPGKPRASRIVPVTVFVDGRYEDGGLYLARPAPLALEADTSYDLLQAGAVQGTFDILGDQNVDGYWLGFGKWKPLAPPKPVKKLAPSKVPPRVVEDHDPDRPRFKGGDGPASSGGKPADSKGGSTTTEDGDRPTLHKKGDSTDTRADSTSAGSPPSAQDDPDRPTLHRKGDANGSTDAAGAGTAPDDPDRPHLRKRSDAAKGLDPGEDGAAVTSANEPDPDRPKMSRGKITVSAAMEATKLSGLPADLQQMAAVSDASAREPHVFTYQWPSADDATKMQAAVELLARRVVLAAMSGPSGAASPAKPPLAPAKSPFPGGHTNVRRLVTARPLPVTLTDQEYHSYELSYNAGPTLVLTAKALIGANNSGASSEKYVTIVAQPDFDGNPQVRLQSITDKDHLDITPRMRLVDAVDTDGDNRAELVFELRRTSDRRFAIYKVAGTRAEQQFATASLPYETPTRVDVKTN